MLVRMKTSMGGDGFSYAAGEIVQVPDEVGERWIRVGAAGKAPANATADHEYTPGRSQLDEPKETTSGRAADSATSASSVPSPGGGSGPDHSVAARRKATTADKR